MKFLASTVYSYERLLRFSSYTSLKKKWVWITMAAATFIVALCFSLQFFLIGYDKTLTWSFFGIILIDSLYLFLCFILPRITLKKSPGLNAKIIFEFYDDYYRIDAELPNGTEQSELKYAVIRKIESTKEDLYLYVAENQAYIVDKSAFTLGEAEDFVSFVQSKIETTKFLSKRKNK